MVVFAQFLCARFFQWTLCFDFTVTRSGRCRLYVIFNLQDCTEQKLNFLETMHDNVCHRKYGKSATSMLQNTLNKNFNSMAFYAVTLHKHCLQFVHLHFHPLLQIFKTNYCIFNRKQWHESQRHAQAYLSSQYLFSNTLFVYVKV